MMEGPTSPLCRRRGLQINGGGQGPSGVYGKEVFCVQAEIRAVSPLLTFCGQGAVDLAFSGSPALRRLSKYRFNTA